MVSLRQARICGRADERRETERVAAASSSSVARSADVTVDTRFMESE